LDSEWLQHGTRAPALISFPDATLSFGGRTFGETAGEPVVTPEGVLGGLIVAAVQEVAEVNGPVEVTGSGIVAEGSGLLLGSRRARRTETPAAVIETTGAPNAIATALQRLQDLGTLVLAGESLGRQVAIDLYGDVHTRGLRVVGVSMPAEDRAPVVLGPELEGLLARSLVSARLGSILEPGAAWYCVTP
jgi:hypothetical protein